MDCTSYPSSPPPTRSSPRRSVYIIRIWSRFFIGSTVEHRSSSVATLPCTAPILLIISVPSPTRAFLSVPHPYPRIPFPLSLTLAFLSPQPHTRIPFPLSLTLAFLSPSASHS